MFPTLKAMRFAALVAVIVCAVPLVGGQYLQLPHARHATTTQTAIDAYIYGYPLVLTEYERRFMLASGKLEGMNQFHHDDHLIGITETAVRRSNNDTLYSSAFLDLKAEPIVLHVPDTTGIYYVMQLMDAWTNTFAAPGTRTTGPDAQDFVIVGPGWRHKLPRHLPVFRSPTNMVWIIGRTQVNANFPPEGTCSAIDYTTVHNIQQQYTLTPLSKWLAGETAAPSPSPQTGTVSSTLTPPDLVAQLSGVEFFQTLSTLMRDNPPAPQDIPALIRFARIGFIPGRPFNPPPALADKINAAPPEARQLMDTAFDNLGENINGWRVTTSGIGTYGTDYLTRAGVAQGAIGANLPEDGFYPATSVAIVDSQQESLTSANKYVIHFDPAPPVNAFWSVTAYDASGYFIANNICRYAIHSTDQAIDNKSVVDILLQPNQPTDTNSVGYWLPTPSPSAPFNLMIRMYWPADTALQKDWVPPPVQKLP